MESKSQQSLFSDPDHYVKSFQAFCALSAKFSVYTIWVDGVFNEAIVSKIQAKLRGQEELRVLGVGSGSGEMDCIMLAKLLQRFPRINNRVVEPLPELLAQYKALMQSKASRELQGVNCDWRQQTIQQYEKAGDSTKFHFISAVHSVYYMADDVDGGLMNLYNRLEPGGVLLVIINSDTGRFCRLQGLLSSGLDRFNLITSATIWSSLDRLGISYTQYRQPCRLNITECFDEASKEGALLVDFLTNVVNFKETAPEDAHKSVMSC